MLPFRSKLEGVDWSSVYSNNSVHESYDTFSSLLTSAYSMSFPLQPACSNNNGIYIALIHRCSKRLNLTALQNPGSQMVSLLLVKGKILFTNSSS